MVLLLTVLGVLILYIVGYFLLKGKKGNPKANPFNLDKPG